MHLPLASRLDPHRDALLPPFHTHRCTYLHTQRAGILDYHSRLIVPFPVRALVRYLLVSDYASCHYHGMFADRLRTREERCHVGFVKLPRKGVIVNGVPRHFLTAITHLLEQTAVCRAYFTRIDR